jgi:hypothetical protein
LTAPGPATRPAATASGARAEVIVVTHDPELESALRQASPAAPLMVASTPAALADLLMTGRAGALVLDVAALDAAALTVARHLAEQFPDVPLVAVGSREDEARLAGLISTGLVYRFLHRPVSVARARTFVEAALRRHGSHRASAPTRATAPAPPRRSGLSPALAVAAACATLGIGLVLALRAPSPAESTAAPRAAASGLAGGGAAAPDTTSAAPTLPPRPAPAAVRVRAPGSTPAAAPPPLVAATASVAEPAIARAAAPAAPAADASATPARADATASAAPPAAAASDAAPTTSAAARAAPEAAAGDPQATPAATVVDAPEAGATATSPTTDAVGEERATREPPQAT